MVKQSPEVEAALIDAYIDSIKDAAPGTVDVTKLTPISGTEFTNMDKMSGAFETAPDPYIPVYSHIDGGRSIVLVSMLSTQLKKKVPHDPQIRREIWGKPAFSLTPTFDPISERLLCMLHPDHPMREELNGMGLKGATCIKDNIPTEKDVLKHFERRHADSYAVYNSAVARSEREEDRTFQREMLGGILKLMKDKADG